MPLIYARTGEVAEPTTVGGLDPLLGRETRGRVEATGGVATAGAGCVPPMVPSPSRSIPTADSTKLRALPRPNGAPAQPDCAAGPWLASSATFASFFPSARVDAVDAGAKAHASQPGVDDDDALLFAAAFELLATTVLLLLLLLLLAARDAPSGAGGGAPAGVACHPGLARSGGDADAAELSHGEGCCDRPMPFSGGLMDEDDLPREPASGECARTGGGRCDARPSLSLPPRVVSRPSARDALGPPRLDGCGSLVRVDSSPPPPLASLPRPSLGLVATTLAGVACSALDEPAPVAASDPSPPAGG